MKRLFNILLLFGIITCSMSQDFSGSDYQMLIDSVKSILFDLEKYGSFSSDGSSVSQEYINRYRARFGSQGCMVVNDITEKYFAEKSSFSLPEGYVEDKINLQLYLAIVLSNYPFGIMVDYDIDEANTLFPKLISRKENRYMAYVKVSKELVGFFRESKILRYNGIQYIELNFIKSGEKLHSFSIEGVLNEKEIEKELMDRKMRGQYAGIGYTFSSKSLVFENFSETLFDYSFNMEFEPVNEMGIYYRLMFNKNVGITLGAFNSTFNTKLKIPEFNHQYDYTVPDSPDNELYNPIIILEEMEQVMTINSVNIPISMDLLFGDPNSIMPYLFFGFNLGIVSGSTYGFNGTGETQGYYDNYPVRLYDIQELGFERIEYKDEVKNWEINKMLVGLDAGFGISALIKDKISLNLGINGSIYPGSLKYEKPVNSIDYISIFGVPKRITLVEVGAMMKIFYKFK